MQLGPLSAVCEPTAACKICSTAAPLFGVADFTKNCEVRNPPALPLVGVPIYYYRCPACEFLFTTALDAFTHEDFQRHVYNAEYARVDPDYAERRPANNAGNVATIAQGKRDLSILDYGGGNGLLADHLRAAGFANVQTYDPFSPRFATRPTGTYDLVTSFEVLEHSPRPVETMAELSSLIADPGIALVSTLLQPADIGVQGVNWWYVGPRNGHVSIHSRKSLTLLANRFELHVASINDGFHLICRGIPEFARGFLKPA